ncbi:hypothetical protein JCM10213_005004 [Rhodosporidiobolus nylandii]
MRSLAALLTLAGAAVAAPTSSSNSSSSTSSAKHSSPSLTADGFTSTKWIKAFERARSIVENMPLQQKVNFSDMRNDTKGCAGLTYPLEAAGNVEFCFADGPTGINTRYSTQFPAEVTTAATWDRDLFTLRGDALGKEYHTMGIQVPLSIVAGPMGRSVYGGRNWEGWSADPWLAGEATKLTVEAFQKNGVQGLVKHFILNEQEYLRVGVPGGYVGGSVNYTIDSVADAATVRELYAWPYAEAIRSGAGSVMCSYNKVNGTLACESDEVLNKLLKEELNFGGYVLSDWSAPHDTAGAALNGTDVVQFSYIWGAPLGEMIANGSLPDTIMDDKIIRILTPYYALDQPSLPSLDLNRFTATKRAKEVVLDVAKSSLTLLKNVRSDNTSRGLPLKGLQDITLVGSPAGPGPYGMVSSISPLFYFNTNATYPGFVTDGFGSGGSPIPYAFDPFNEITRRAREEDRPPVVDAYLSDDPTEGMASSSSGNISFLDYKLSYTGAAVVFVSAVAMEGYDRKDLSLQNGGEDLINYVADRHNDTIVVVTAPGPVDMSSWVNHANVSAVVYAYFPTSVGGEAIASVLFGDTNPSGKLPFTLAKTVEDYPNTIYHGEVKNDPIANFSEGVFLDYKYFDQKEIEPMYEFGYGLSYSSFSFSNVKVWQSKKKQPALVRETNEKFFLNGKAASGLYDLAYTVQATVKNTGSVDGAEVVQLYLTFPSSVPREFPVRSLRGFEKPYLKAGESKTVSFKLRNKDLAYYSVEKGGWVVPEGEFTVSVGSSSRKLPLKTKFEF